MSRKKKCKKERGNTAPARFSLSKSQVKVAVTGFNRARLLDALAREGITVKRVINITSNQFIIIIYQKEYAKTFAICNRLCYNCIVVEYIGLVFWLKSKLNRIALLVGALSVVTLFCLSNAFLLDIKVTGAENIATTQFLTYLKSNGVKVGAVKGSLNHDEIREITRSFENVAECSVKVVGHTLFIHLTERDQTTPSPSSAQNLCSRYDATVTRIVCEKGTAKVKVGQRVRKGETLIEGKLYDQLGQEMLETEASGKVYGTVTQKRVFIASTTSYAVIRTGKSKAITSLYLWGMAIGKATSPYESYESECTQTFLPLLPVKAERTVFYETALKKVEQTLDEMVEKCAEKAHAEFIDDVNEGVEVKTHAQKLTETEYEITVYLTTEREIT
ncbi:MAG: sporulation protein YqfD [Clostridia bacterium]|nr:sporulation protein YqfD [Clostridia bacterium]